MKTYPSLLVATFLCWGIGAQAASVNASAPWSVWPERTRDFNDDWRFIGEDSPAPPDVKDARCSPVQLPHTWNDKDTLVLLPRKVMHDVHGHKRTKAKSYRMGGSWYLRDLRLGEKESAGRTFVRFGAAGTKAQVYLNGEKVGAHEGGFSAFTVELSKQLRPGINQLAVRVDNKKDANLSPTTDWLWNLYGGLYRGVQLIHAPTTCLSRDYRGGPGVRVWSTRADDSVADLHVKVRIDGPLDDGLRVMVELFAANGTLVASVEDKAATEVTLPFAEIKKPALWTPDTPTLYTVAVSLKMDGKVSDRAVVRHGFRSYRFTPDKGFFLNGKHLMLEGVSRHQDIMKLGNALLPEHHERDFRLLKEAGFNWVRLAHYQQDDYVLQLCDELGILVLEEIPFVRQNNISKAFEGNLQTMMKEMIEQHFNHPSVVLWGLGNEIWYTKGADGRATQYDMISRLNDTVHAEDPTRKSILVNGDADNASNLGIYNIPDVIGCNMYRGWYRGVPADVAPRIRTIHSRHPDKPILFTEFGAGCEIGKHVKQPKAWDMSEEYQCWFLRQQKKQIDKLEFLSGWNLWLLADTAWYHSESGPRLRNNKGLLTADRKPKNSYYVMRNLLTGTPPPFALDEEAMSKSDPGKKPLETGDPFVVTGE